MKKSFKILSFVISIFIFFSFLGNNRVKAVSAGAVLGAEGISAAVSFLLSTIFTDSLVIAGNAAEQADYTVTVTTDEAQQILDDYFYSFNIDSLEGIDDYNCLMTITDPNQFLSYCGVSDPISLSGAQRIVYSSLQCTHNQVLNRKIITSAKGLVLQPISFSELLNDTSADLISYFSNSASAVSFTENGLRTLTMSSSFSFFASLASQYGASSVHCNTFWLHSEVTYFDFYCVFVVSDGSTIYVPTQIYLPPSSGQKFYPSQESFHYVLSYFNDAGLRVDNFNLYIAYNLHSNGSYNFMPTASCGLSSDYLLSYADGSTYPYKKLADYGFNVYTFTFNDKSAADRLFNDLVDHVPALSASDVNDTGDYAVDLPFSDTEKKVDVYEQDHPGVDDIDIVVNPGAVKADDGTTTYNPSITVNDTPLDDIDVTGYLDLDDTLDRFQLPSSISTKFPFSLPFDIYNLFNVFSADPVTPQFTVPLDMTSVGGEVYNIDIDLSDFDDIANIVRWLLYGLFLIGLVILTNKLIGRG